jgi:uncharacterized integral membrane protein
VQFFFWLIFLMVIDEAIFVIQNLAAPGIVMNFLFWKFKTYPTDLIFQSIGWGILTILLLWIPRGIKNSFRARNLKKRVSILETKLKNEKGSKQKEP